MEREVQLEAKGIQRDWERTEIEPKPETKEGEIKRGNSGEDSGPLAVEGFE